jgi:hypothetical protein
MESLTSGNIGKKGGNHCKNYAVGEKGKLKPDLFPLQKYPTASTAPIKGVASCIPNYGKLKIR